MTGSALPSSALPSRRFGTIGSVVGLLALIAAVLPHWVLPMIYPPPPADQIVVDVGHRLKERLIARAKGVVYQAPAHKVSDADRWSEGLSAGAVALGLLAIVFAVFALLFREERLPAGIAVALGVGAIAFELAVVAIGILIVLSIIYIVMSQFS